MLSAKTAGAGLTPLSDERTRAGEASTGLACRSRAAFLGEVGGPTVCRFPHVHPDGTVGAGPEAQRYGSASSRRDGVDATSCCGA